MSEEVVIDLSGRKLSVQGMNNKFSQAKRFFAIIIPINFLLILVTTLPAAIVSVSIPQNSQCPLCRPSLDNLWTVAAPPYPLGTNGIGIILEPAIQELDYPEYALHQNNVYFPPSPPYVADYTPDPAMAVVTYVFDSPQIVSGVEIAQHQNGITRIEGFSGDSLQVLISVGSVFGPSGDVTSGFVVPLDGTPQTFNFGNTSVSGTVFQFIVRKTVHPFAFATFRAFPLDQNGNRIPAATVADPRQMIEELIALVADLNMKREIENSLDAKLTTALQALDDHNQNNDVAACNSLDAFINETSAQSGNKISSADAASLTAQAKVVKMALGCP